MIKFLRRDEGPSDPADPAAASPGGASLGGASQEMPSQEAPNDEARAFGTPRRDDGLGVPPFKPGGGMQAKPDAQQSGAFGLPRASSAPPPAAQDTNYTPDKETPMARSPFSSSQTPGPASGTPAPAASMPGGAFRPNMPRTPEAAERRTLVVGRGISLQGVVQDAERLVVEGTVEATMIHAAELAIAQGGVFKGEVEVEEAEIAGTIDGTLTARHALIVRGTGRVLGTARCKRLQVEDGGQITGRIEMLTEGSTDASD